MKRLKLCRECSEKDYCLSLCDEAIGLQGKLSTDASKESRPLIIGDTRESKECSYNECKHKAFTGGLCEFHYNGSVTQAKPNIKTEECIVYGCSEPTESHKGRGNMCRKHHKQRKTCIRRDTNNRMINNFHEENTYEPQR